MQSRYTVDEIAELLAKCIVDEIMSQAVCNSLINVTQTAAINCSEDDLTALRNSDACIDAVLANDPNQTRICNSCYIVNSSQTATINLQLQCGSNVFTHVRGSFVDKLTTLKPRAPLNGMTLSAINEIVTLVTNSTIIPTVKQAVLIGQNLSNRVSGSNQTIIVDTIMRSFIDMPDLHNHLLNLQKLLNDFGISIGIGDGNGIRIIIPTPSVALPIVDIKPESDTNNSSNAKKTSINMHYVVIALLVAIILVVVITKRKKTVGAKLASDVIESTTIDSA